MLTIPEVERLANLARIAITPAEAERFSATVSVAIDYVKMLNEVDTSGVPMTDQVTGLADVTRADVAYACEWRDQLIAAFSQQSDNELVVPAVFEKKE